jgi:hypothetical protein
MQDSEAPRRLCNDFYERYKVILSCLDEPKRFIDIKFYEGFYKDLNDIFDVYRFRGFDEYGFRAFSAITILRNYDQFKIEKWHDETVLKF